MEVPKRRLDQIITGVKTNLIHEIKDMIEARPRVRKELSHKTEGDVEAWF